MSYHMAQQSHFWAYIHEKIKTLIQKDTCTPIFIAALFTIGKRWRKTKCPSADEWIKFCYQIWSFSVGSVVKNLPTMQETWVQFLGWKDLLEEGTATHSSILAWRMPWTEKPSDLQSQGHKESDTIEATEHTHSYQI